MSNYTKTDRKPKVLPSCSYAFACALCKVEFPKGSWMLWFPVWRGERKKGRGICKECAEK